MSRNPIQDNFVILCTQLNLEKILPYLKQERMVTTDEYEILTNPNFTARQKREKLLIWLPRKGRNYFTNFGKCLVWSGQTELARHIGVDVALVPEAPFKLPEDEPTPEQQQQQMMHLLRSLISSTTTQQAPLPPPSSAPVYSAGSAQHHQQQSTGPGPAHAPVQPSPAVVHGGGGNVPLAHFDPPSNARAPQVLPQPAPVHPCALQPVPMDYTSSVASVYHQQPPGFVLRASVPNEEPTQSKVFILYCKDPQLPPTFSDDVLDLADTLNHCGGFRCMVDHYTNLHPESWNIWTQQKIEESQYVLLVLSPMLAQKIMNPVGEDVLHMEKGKYYVNGIVNYIHPPKFIPVFLNHCIPANYHLWIPAQLRMYTAYHLNIAELRAVLQVPEGSPENVFHEMLRTALHDEKFKMVASLVSHLRNETDTLPPRPPPVPVKVPPPEIPPPASNKVGKVLEESLIHPIEEEGGRWDENMLSYSHEQDIGHPVSEVHNMAGVAEEHSPDHEEKKLFVYNKESGNPVTPMQAQEEDLEADNIQGNVMRRVAIRVKDKWFDLGRRLGVHVSELEAIKNNLNHPADYESATKNMFRLWKLTKGELATNQALKQALVDIEYGRLAQELFQDDELISRMSSR